MIRGRSVSSIVVTTTAVTLAGAAACSLIWLIRAYGVEGALRYIWDGDPNPEHLRGFLNAFNTAQNSIETHTQTIADLEEALERARQHTSESGRPASTGSCILEAWRNKMQEKPDLRRILASLSYDLDAVAAMIDQVQSEELRQRKKRLSQQVVALMNRMDILIEAFKKHDSSAQSG